MLHIVILSIASLVLFAGVLSIYCCLTNKRNEALLDELRKNAIKRREQEYAHYNR